MGLQFNPPPGWPAPPPGFTPPPGWQPDPSWPPAPPGWRLWTDDGAQPGSPARRGTNGFAITSFITGLLGAVVLSVIFGVVGLSQIRRRQQGGRGFAITGLVLSGLWVAVAVAVIGAGFFLSAHRAAATGQIIKSGRVGVFSVRAGDCFQNPTGSGQLIIRDVTAVPCGTPHNAQVFAAFNATDASYPGNTALRREASQGCHARMAGNLDLSKLTTAMSVRFLVPEQQSWADGHRRVTCLVVDSAADLTSSLLRSRPAG